jgi:hypothetical protein
MKNISFLLLSLVMLVFAGCSVEPIEIDQSLGGNGSSSDSTESSSEDVKVDSTVEPEVIVDAEEKSVEVQVDGNNVTGSLNDDGTIVVESRDSSASGSIADDGTIIVESNVDISNSQALALSEWCIPGQKIDNQVDETSSVAFIISGIVEFKGEEYCLSEGIVTAGGLDVPALIYAKDLTSEFWFVTELMGQSIEKKIQPSFQ